MKDERRFKVTFEYIVNDTDSDGKCHKDCLNNDGQGYTYEEAADEARWLHAMSFPNKNYNARIVEM